MSATIGPRCNTHKDEPMKEKEEPRLGDLTDDVEVLCNNRKNSNWITDLGHDRIYFI